MTRTLAFAMAAMMVFALAGVANAADEIKGDVYTLGVCPISGKALGPKAISKVYDGREVKFCCDGCPGAFEKDTEASFAKLDEKIIEAQEKHYTPENCPVKADNALGDEPVAFVYNNRLIKTCCKGCVKKFNENPEEFTAALDKEIIAKQGEAYPLKNCIVSDEPLGSMGDPVEYVVGNRLVKFCCKSCKGAFDNDPAKFLSKLEK